MACAPIRKRVRNPKTRIDVRESQPIPQAPQVIGRRAHVAELYTRRFVHPLLTTDERVEVRRHLRDARVVEKVSRLHKLGGRNAGATLIQGGPRFI
jgi:hypothetical protein